VALILDVPGLARHSGISVRGHGADEAEAPVEAPAPAVPHEMLILCRAHGCPVAIPQADIARLEEFPEGAVERLGERRVVQYRGGLLPLLELGSLLGLETPGPEARDTVRVVVVEREGHSIGLVVDELLEIVEEPIGSSQSPRPGVRASTVIRGQAADVLDVDALLALPGTPAVAAGA
jgi:two-component system chemotaxis sensor kinase CheA